MHGSTLLSIIMIATVMGLTPLIDSDYDIIPAAHAQVSINVTETTPCFLNYTAGVEMWQNCGFGEDYVAAAVLPFEWVTGGLFSMIVVAILIIMTYIKYHSVLYPIVIGLTFLPTSFFLFPEVFLSYAIILAFVGIGAIVWYVIVRQTKEYA